MDKHPLPAPVRIGVDVGGSKILAVVFDGDGHPIARAKRKTRPELGYEAVLDRIAETVDEALEELDASATAGAPLRLGVALPGPVRHGGAVLARAVNLGWHEVPVAADLAARLDGAQVRLGNDVNCAGLAEARLGAGRGARSAALLFVGTGLGGALVIDGKLVEGAQGVAGEFGHIPGPFDHAPCACGQLGCLETVASKRGLLRLIAAARDTGQVCHIEDLADLRSKDLLQAVEAGCPCTLAALDRCAAGLAWAVGLLTASVDPEVVIFGGGVMERLYGHLLPRITHGLAGHPFLRPGGMPRLVPAALDDVAVAAGAALLLEAAHD
jgi:glucokinase